MCIEPSSVFQLFVRIVHIGNEKSKRLALFLYRYNIWWGDTSIIIYGYLSIFRTVPENDHMIVNPHLSLS